MNYSLTFSRKYACRNSLFNKYLPHRNYIWWSWDKTEHKTKKILVFSGNFLKKVLILWRNFAIMGKRMSKILE